MPKIVYTYMIVFVHGRGTGRMELFRESKIKNFDDLKSVDELVSKTNGFPCTVHDYKLMNISIKKRNFFELLNSEKQLEDL